MSQLDKFFVSKEQIGNSMGYRGAGVDWGGGGGGGWNSGWDNGGGGGYGRGTGVKNGRGRGGKWH